MNRLLRGTRTAALAAVLAGAQACGQAQQIGGGPLETRNMRPYDLLFLQFVPEAPDTLAAGERRFTLQMDSANMLLTPRPSPEAWVYEDCEVERLRGAWRLGMRDGGELGVFVPLLWRNGGFMDDLITRWHHLLGLSGNGDDVVGGRDAYPRYACQLMLYGASGRATVVAGPAAGPGDVQVTYKRPLLRSTARAALAWRAGLKLPTGNPGLLLGSGAADVGLATDGRYALGRDVSLYGGVGVAATGHATRVPNQRTVIPQYYLCAQYRANGRDSYLLQVDGAPAAVRTGLAFADGLQSTISFGYRRVLTRKTQLSLSFAENGDYHNYGAPVLGNIGPDFTLSAALEWR